MMKYFLLVIYLLTGTATAEVYKWKDSDGHVHFSDKPPKTEQAEKMNIKTYAPPATTSQTPSDKNTTTPAAVQKQIVMYATSWCGYCKKAREYFRIKNIPYTEYDIETNAQAKKTYDAFGGRGVPVIFVDQERLNGFSEERFEQVYQ